jgi:anti-sigma factor RsiW
MKTPSEDHDLIRWLDGEMKAAELASFTARLESDPVLKSEAELMQRMSRDMRSSLPAEMPVPFGDFFNSQIQMRISQEESSMRDAPAARASWLDWFRLPGFATIAAVTAAMVIAGVMIYQQSPSSASYVLSTYAPNQKVQVNTYHSAEAHATVLMLDGLEDLPADRKVVGYHIERSETEQAVATTTLYGERGEVVLVVSKDARNQPRLLAAANPRG